MLVEDRKLLRALAVQPEDSPYGPAGQPYELDESFSIVRGWKFRHLIDVVASDRFQLVLSDWAAVFPQEKFQHSLFGEGLPDIRAVQMVALSKVAF